MIRYSVFSKGSNNSSGRNVGAQMRGDFLEIVSQKYNDDELVEWEPAPPPISRPEEPGNLGIFELNFFCTHVAPVLNMLLILIGHAVVIPDHLKKESERRFTEHHFNIVASDMMSLNRTMPDIRTPE